MPGRDVYVSEGSMVRFMAIIFFIMVDYNISTGQELLFHKNRIREVFYKAGDVLSFRIRDEKTKITAEIKGFTDSLIIFQNFSIKPDEITHLYFDSKTKTWYIFRFKLERIFLISGAGYALLDILNTGELNRNTILAGGSLITAGLLAGLLIKKRIRIKGKRKLLIIQGP